MASQTEILEKQEFKQSKIKQLFHSLGYALYVIVHPFFRFLGFEA